MKSRTAPRQRGSRARWWVGAAVVAAGALAGAYLLDPLRGAQRRSRVVEKARHLVGRTGRQDWMGGPTAWPEEAPPDVDSES